MDELLKLPKIELHLHLDGSVRIETANIMLGRDATSEMICDDTINNLNDYITKFNLPVSLMQTKENLSRIASELVEDLKSDNVIYAEIRFAPILHTEQGLSLEEIVDAVITGTSKVSIKTNLILCMMRNASFEDNKKIIYLAKKYLNKGVCAIDLAGAEAMYKTSNFKNLFAIAKKEGIPYTIHAGEADGPSSIKSALDFGAKRIGHGVRCFEDKNIVKILKEDNICLEVCPTSNLNTCIISKYQDHPIKKMLDTGLKVTINTDNRTVSNVTLTEEYKKLVDSFNFTQEDFLTCNINAVSSSFLNTDERNQIITILKDGYKAKK